MPCWRRLADLSVLVKVLAALSCAQVVRVPVDLKRAVIADLKAAERQ